MVHHCRRCLVSSLVGVLFAAAAFSIPCPPNATLRKVPKCSFEPRELCVLIGLPVLLEVVGVWSSGSMPVQASANKHHDRVPSTCTHPSDIQCKEKAVPKQKSSAKSSGPQKPELLIHVCGPTRAFWHWCFSCPVPFLELAKVLNGMFLFWWPETAAIYLFSPILFSGEKTSNSAAADRGFQPFPAKRLADSRSTRVTLGPLEFANFWNRMKAGYLV